MHVVSLRPSHLWAYLATGELTDVPNSSSIICVLFLCNRLTLPQRLMTTVLLLHVSVHPESRNSSSGPAAQGHSGLQVLVGLKSPFFC
jgi:hypothetical protein